MWKQLLATLDTCYRQFKSSAECQDHILTLAFSRTLELKITCVQGCQQLFPPVASLMADPMFRRSGSHSQAGIGVHSFPA